MKKKNSEMGMNNGSLIALAVGVGTANAVALDDPAVGFGISIFIFGTVYLGRVIQDSRRNMKRGSLHNED